MEVTTKRKRLRILCGPVDWVEGELNQLLDDYGAIVWTFFDCGGVPTASVVLLSLAEMRKAAFMQPGHIGRH